MVRVSWWRSSCVRNGAFIYLRQLNKLRNYYAEFSLFGRTDIYLISSNSPIDALSINRRQYLQRQTATGGGYIAIITTLSPSSAAQAATNTKSRTDGYAIQHTEREWAYILSGPQYNILRRGGTERQKGSILNTFTAKDVGLYRCAGCNTPLFSSQDKFSR